MPFAELSTAHTVQYVENAELGYNAQEDKLPIVTIHGLGSSQNYYVPVMPYLDGHRVVALSNYGAARSKSRGEKLTMEELAEDVVALMDYLKIPKAVVVGHSMGGPMALTVAARHPDRVAGVVAIGPVNPHRVRPEMFTSRIETVTNHGMEPLANTVPKAATGSKSTPLMWAMIRELILNQEPKSYASHCDAIVNIKDPGFDKMKTPVLLLAGKEDPSTPLEGVQNIHERLGSPRKELKVYDGVGHWHCIEVPDLVGGDIKAFAASLA
ncbi:uncharacterized protein MYCFIDRAFT_63872 [Pseudocercospora fijiensis CIRAD86]|uniref:AB hydrolase-1 domain-containing protein n=1 Tax=Pseudocercospora fijiensis (strain CIRAD86) TaxID=383855 RepID=M3AKS9_PSEFD|nr:uncharacterized protein MYCFIDRAFT_63872 [Pseudocercospora fijiensis CIRAD86]EME78072.1 hypothetical protein MYCFIDRAFT_63872 [Pseudocercospora fijiensis CIRAD86]